MTVLLGMAYMAAVAFGLIAVVVISFVLFLMVRAFVLSVVSLSGRIVALFR